jgi:dihydropteroate synthase
MGFGKTRRQNFQILAELDRLRRFRLPVLIGASRKSFVQAIVAGEGLNPSRPRKARTNYWALTSSGLRAGVGSGESRAGTPLPLLLGDAAAVVTTILGGAHVVRVHDVAGIIPAVRIADAILQAEVKD